MHHDGDLPLVGRDLAAAMQITAVSCASTSYCVAVGSYLGTSGGSDGLLLTSSGESWTAAQAPVPSAARTIPNLSVETFGVSCPSTSECLVTEGGANGAANPYFQVNGVSCPSVSHCVAIGAYLDTSGDDEGLLLPGSG